jgi:hypothetical protein
VADPTRAALAERLTADAAVAEQHALECEDPEADAWHRERAAAEAVRQRDVLWAKALIASLDAREIERVTRAFNASRPDPDPALSREPTDEDWPAALRALAGIPCDERERTGGAPGDEQYSCYSECVTCRARRALGAALSRAPTDEEVAREVDAAWRKVGFNYGKVPHG